MVYNNRLFQLHFILSKRPNFLQLVQQKHSQVKCSNLNESKNVSGETTNITITKSDSLIKTASEKKVEDFGEMLSRWYERYQTIVGLSEVTKAQENVSKLSAQLLQSQSLRRKLQSDVTSAHQQVLQTHQKITTTEMYTEEHYSLFEKARHLNHHLKHLQEQFAEAEEEERNTFVELSSAIKSCHEKERTQAEQAKYWSVLISVISAALASLITSVNNWVRIREIKDHSTSLHDQLLNKYEELQSNLMTTSNALQRLSNDQQIEDAIQKTLEKVGYVQPSNTSDENTLALNALSNDIYEPTEISYIRVMSYMGFGIVIGTAVTAVFYSLSGP